MKLIHDIIVHFEIKCCTQIIVLDDKNFIVINKYGK